MVIKQTLIFDIKKPQNLVESIFEKLKKRKKYL